MRNIIKKWKATGTVNVVKRTGRSRKIKAKHVRRMVRKVSDDPQTTSTQFQEDLLMESLYIGSPSRGYTKNLHGWEMPKKPFVHTHHKKVA